MSVFAILGRQCFSVSTASTTALLVSVFWFAGSTHVFAQAAKAPMKTIEPVSVTTRDGWTLQMTYYKSDKGREAPVVILLHRKGGSRLVWQQPLGPQKKGFAEVLQDQGYAVVAVDLRKHGESKGPTGDTSELSPFDYPRMVEQDLEAVKTFIYEENQKQNLNMRKTAIIAPEMSAPVALYYALADWVKRPYNDSSRPEFGTPRGQDIRALVLLSPEANVPPLTSARVLRDLKSPAWGVAFFVAYGSEDSLDKGDARQIFQQAGGKPSKPGNEEKDERVHLMKYEAKWRGTDLLGKNLNLEAYILAFLDLNLQKLSGPENMWRDRESRLSK